MQPLADHTRKRRRKECPLEQHQHEIQKHQQITLTPQQLDIINFAPFPGQPGKMLRVTAGAGTGKTSTVVKYAEELVRKGHNKIIYLTFNNSAAEEAARRFALHTIGKVETRTIHSAAFTSINSSTNRTLLEDHDIDKLIIERFSDKLDMFLSQLPSNTPGQIFLKKNIFRKVVFFIRKTLINFLQSKYSLEEWSPHEWWSVYFPAKQFHEKNEHHFTYAMNYKLFYVSRAKELFHLFTQSSNVPDNGGGMHVSTYDTVMKEAQLAAIELPYTAILVDESQDLNACQIDWVATQNKLYNSHVFLVGDPAQSIYSFRGARSQLLLQLSNCEDKLLTVTHRFGRCIANISNTILFCKENSPQTNSTKKDKLWMPYRLQGKPSTKGVVTTKSLLAELIQESKSQVKCDKLKSPVVVLAFTNLELLEICIEQLLSVDNDNNGEMFTHLKIAINGHTEKSDKGAWSNIESKIKDFYQVFIGAETILRFHPWNGNGHQMVTWRDIERDVEDLELTDYSKIVSIINKYGNKSLEIFKQFTRNILKPAYTTTAYDTDVILSTIHGAKGMEWDRVQLFASSMSTFASRLDKYSIYSRQQIQHQHSFQRAPRNNIDSSIPHSEINYANYGDGLNLWYVALTRAKDVLSVPPEFMSLINDFEYILKNHLPEEGCGGSYRANLSHSEANHIKVDLFTVIDVSVAECKDDRGVDEDLQQVTPLNVTKIEEVPPKLFYLNGNFLRPAISIELQSLYTHLALPWAREMVATDGGLFIDGVNLLAFYPAGSSSSRSSSNNQQQLGSPVTSSLISPSKSLAMSPQKFRTASYPSSTLP